MNDRLILEKEDDSKYSISVCYRIYVKKISSFSRKAAYVRNLLRDFPDADLEAVQERYPDLNIYKIKHEMDSKHDKYINKSEGLMENL